MINSEIADICHLCINTDFLIIKSKFNVQSYAHEDFEDDPFKSFLKTFSIIFQAEEQEIMNILVRRSREENFLALQNLEYGTNLAAASRSDYFISNLACIGALAEEYHRDIIVLCNFYSLNCIHKGSNAFVFKSIRRIAESEPAVCCVFGMNMYHPLVYDVILNSIGASDVYRKINYRTGLDVVGEPNMEDEEIEEPREIDFIEIEVLGRSHEEFPNIGQIADESFLTTGPRHTAARSENLVRIDEFLDHHFTDTIPPSLSAASYTTNVKLDVKNSTIPLASTNVTKTFDIDGLFGIIRQDQCSLAIKSPVKFWINPTIVDKRTLKNIKKFSPAAPNNSLRCIKIGFLELSLGSIDLIVVIDTNISISDMNLTTIAKECAEHARTLPCRNDDNHIRNCQSLPLINSHRSTTRASTTSFHKNESEQYSTKTAVCYIHHFIKMYNEKLSEMRNRGTIGITMFFKCVGSKSTTFTDKLSDCGEYLKTFEMAIDFTMLDCSKIWLDFSITASAESNDGPVIKTFTISYFI